jgi:hypothetical protein
MGMKSMDNTHTILDKYPFLTLLKYGGREYLGIIQNRDDTITSMYDLESIKNDEDRVRFLMFGDQWWWESNRCIPINLFLKSEWSEFRYCLKTFNSKDVEIIKGPQVSLKELAQKKTKKRSIFLVKKI